MAATAEYGRAGRPARLPARPKSGEPPPAATATAATAATDGGREAARLVCVQSVGHDGDSLAPVRICTLQLIRGAKILHIVITLEMLTILYKMLELQNSFRVKKKANMDCYMLGSNIVRC